MTRKDYEALAEALGKAWALSVGLSEDAVFGVSWAMEQVSEVLAQDNPRFSLSTFEAAVFEARDVEVERLYKWARSVRS